MIADTELAAKSTSGTVVTAEEWGTQAMVNKLGAGFVLTGDAKAPIGLAADTTPEPQPKVPEPEPTETEPEPEPQPKPSQTTAAETDAEKPSDTEPQTTTAADTSTKKKGCTGMLGISSVALIAAAGVLVGVLRKKED